MKNSFLWILCLFTSCINNGNVRNSSLSNDTLNIVIVSPYGCLEEVTLYNNGYGYLKSGRKNAVIDAESIDFDSVFSLKNFKIKKSKKVYELNKIIQSFKGKESLKSGMKYDTYRFRVFIDGVNKIDIFGETAELINLLNLIIFDLPLTENPCDYFQNLKARGS